MQTVILRKEAIELGLKHYFTGKPCKYGHVSERSTKSGKCVGCEDIRIKLALIVYNKNRTHILDVKKKYREQNKDKISVSKKKWEAENKNEVLLYREKTKGIFIIWRIKKNPFRKAGNG